MAPSILKTENWNGHPIRFVEKDGEWWAVLKDVCDALDLSARFVRQRLEKDVVSNHPLDTAGGKQEMLVVNEFGIYDTVFQSRKKEAREFRIWVYALLKELRAQSGLEGFEVFLMLDREHQKQEMQRLRNGPKEPTKVDYIKANVIANKAVSNRYGHPKMLKKGDMPPAMLRDREQILENVVELMTLRDKYNLDLSVSEQIYKI